MSDFHMRYRGYLAVLGAASLWGISGVVAKALFNRQIEPWILVEIRLTAAFVLLLIILAVRRLPLQVPREQLPQLFLVGLAMTSAQFTYYLTISLTDVSTALFLQYTAPALEPVVGSAAAFLSWGKFWPPRKSSAASRLRWPWR